VAVPPGVDKCRGLTRRVIHRGRAVAEGAHLRDRPAGLVVDAGRVNNWINNWTYPFLLVHVYCSTILVSHCTAPFRSP
jgi:hypothetical protein